MMYRYLTLNDGTEVVHSDVLPDGRVKVFLNDLMPKTVFMMRRVTFQTTHGRMSRGFPKKT